MADGSKDSVIAPASGSTPKASASAPASKAEYKIAELRDDGTAVVQLEDGRMIVAEIKEGLALRKHAKVEIDHDGEDADGAPLKATVTKVL